MKNVILSLCIVLCVVLVAYGEFAVECPEGTCDCTRTKNATQDCISTKSLCVHQDAFPDCDGETHHDVEEGWPADCEDATGEEVIYEELEEVFYFTNCNSESTACWRTCECQWVPGAPGEPGACIIDDNGQFGTVNPAAKFVDEGCE